MESTVSNRNVYKQVSTVKIYAYTAKLHYIEPQGTGVNGSIYPRFKVSHIHLFLRALSAVN